MSESREHSAKLRAPFPWYGGKRRAAPVVWRAFGNTPNYVEPFAGSVWGVCAWIGGGWCHPDRRLHLQRPSLINKNGHGVHALHRSLPAVGRPGDGIHAPSRKKPLTHGNKGVHRDGAPPDLFAQLRARLRDVRVCCGDWKRVVGRSTLGIDTRHGMTPCAVFLDPPYAHDERSKQLYADDDPDVSREVREWALEHGNDPQLRIALCGFDTEHGQYMPSTWECVSWRSNSSAATGAKERIWFSPHCLTARVQGEMFAEANGGA